MATERAESLRHILRPHDPTTPVTIRVSWTEEVPSVVGRPTTKLAFECRAKDHPEAFPIMMATLSTHALTPSETQLEVFGSYVPAIADRPVDKRIAEASVLAFVREVATCLREDLGSPTVH
jgi:hypothetical protein